MDACSFSSLRCWRNSINSGVIGPCNGLALMGLISKSMKCSLILIINLSKYTEPNSCAMNAPHWKDECANKQENVLGLLNANNNVCEPRQSDPSYHCKRKEIT